MQHADLSALASGTEYNFWPPGREIPYKRVWLEHFTISHVSRSAAGGADASAETRLTILPVSFGSSINARTVASLMTFNAALAAVATSSQLAITGSPHLELMPKTFLGVRSTFAGTFNGAAVVVVRYELDEPAEFQAEPQPGPVKMMPLLDIPWVNYV